MGESDLAALRPFFEQRGDPAVLLLQNLSDQEQIVVLNGEGVASGVAAEFQSEAVARGLGDFLENPQNLLMLWRAVKTGSWPKTLERAVRAGNAAHAPGVRPRTGSDRYGLLFGCRLAACGRRDLCRAAHQRR